MLMRSADTIRLDLEDGVAMNAKEHVLPRLPDVVASAGRGR
jgi:citrate lyase beta subunit